MLTVVYSCDWNGCDVSVKAWPKEGDGILNVPIPEGWFKFQGYNFCSKHELTVVDRDEGREPLTVDVDPTRSGEKE